MGGGVQSHWRTTVLGAGAHPSGPQCQPSSGCSGLTCLAVTLPVEAGTASWVLQPRGVEGMLLRTKSLKTNFGPSCLGVKTGDRVPGDPCDLCGGWGRRRPG